jgi:hypothetical protein
MLRRGVRLQTTQRLKNAAVVDVQAALVSLVALAALLLQTAVTPVFDLQAPC